MQRTYACSGKRIGRLGRKMEPMNDPGFTPTQLAARAADLLRGNDLGTMTSAAPRLYPHMWSWDAAFVAIGLAPLSVNAPSSNWTPCCPRNGARDDPAHRLRRRRRRLLPRPRRWECRDSPARPPPVRHLRHLQPPVHAIALQRILDIAATSHDPRGSPSVPDRPGPRLVRWHRWLAHTAIPNPVGRITRTRLGVRDGQFAAVGRAYATSFRGTDLPPYLREDKHIVTDAAQRPSDLGVRPLPVAGRGDAAARVTTTPNSPQR